MIETINVDAENSKKTPRRVLPEHEGRYKIKLPSGSTERSKQILAKKAMCKQHFVRHFSDRNSLFDSHKW